MHNQQWPVWRGDKHIWTGRLPDAAGPDERFRRGVRNFRERDMRSLLWFAVAGIAASAMVRPAQAALTEEQFRLNTSADLVSLCSASPQDPLYTAALNYCHGFAVGAYSAERAHSAATRARPLFCLPEPQPTRNEAVAGFIAWTKQDPTRLTLPPIEGMFTYLMQQYPCPQRGKPRS